MEKGSLYDFGTVITVNLYVNYRTYGFQDLLESRRQKLFLEFLIQYSHLKVPWGGGSWWRRPSCRNACVLVKGI
jgi:hypothetical protein